MRDVVDGEPRLVLLSLPPQDGLSTLCRGRPRQLKEPARITPEWRGTPVYQVSRGSELLISTGLGSDMAGLTTG